ncbi:unnamed protein product [Protopolystoma xenopodis]|uniref:Uncharacterized protein n=1 Tax=Protopolystoma xenopodis TaxID=117903 RepID=A0A3S5AT04_9PLAT|nr:unnamed protein product [Protopolystoma xenopodis]
MVATKVELDGIPPHGSAKAGSDRGWLKRRRRIGPCFETGISRSVSTGVTASSSATSAASSSISVNDININPHTGMSTSGCSAISRFDEKEVNWAAISSINGINRSDLQEEDEEEATRCGEVKRAKRNSAKRVGRLDRRIIESGQEKPQRRKRRSQNVSRKDVGGAVISGEGGEELWRQKQIVDGVKNQMGPEKKESDGVIDVGTTTAISEIEFESIYYVTFYYKSLVTDPSETSTVSTLASVIIV